MKLIDRLLPRGQPNTNGNDALVSSLNELRDVNEDIRDELRSGGRK